MLRLLPLLVTLFSICTFPVPSIATLSPVSKLWMCRTPGSGFRPCQFTLRRQAAVLGKHDSVHQLGHDILGPLTGLLNDLFNGHRHDLNHKRFPRQFNEDLAPIDAMSAIVTYEPVFFVPPYAFSK